MRKGLVSLLALGSAGMLALNQPSQAQPLFKLYSSNPITIPSAYNIKGDYSAVMRVGIYTTAEGAPTIPNYKVTSASNKVVVNSPTDLMRQCSLLEIKLSDPDGIEVRSIEVYELGANDQNVRQIPYMVDTQAGALCTSELNHVPRNKQETYVIVDLSKMRIANSGRFKVAFSDDNGTSYESFIEVK